MIKPEPPGRSFLCVRHGVTEWNRLGVFQGRTDVALNDEGIAQAQLAATRLQGVAFDIIVSSPLVRAVQTAEIIGAASGKSVSIDADLIECDFGSLEGKSIQQAMKQHGISTREALATILPPEGEAWRTVSVRALRCIAHWLDRHPQADILFVSHDAVMQSMAEALCHRWFDNRHAVPFRFDKTGDAWTLAEAG